MSDLNDLTLPDLLDRLVSAALLDRLLAESFREDFGDVGDITSKMLIDHDRRSQGTLVARAAGVMAGLSILHRATHPLIRAVMEQSEVHVNDGSQVEAGTPLVMFDAPLRTVLAVERTVLNLLGHLSGVATLARTFVEAINGTNAVICDTRKTTPGLRHLEKYATRCGGAHLHRLGLHDAMLVKDNHIAHIPADDLASTLDGAIRRARDAAQLWFVEVEVDTLDQCDRILSLDEGLVDYILLDNMTNDQLREAVALRNRRRPDVRLEASGGVTIDTVRAIAETGVDRISVGAITHSAPRLDVALDVR